MTLMEEAKRAEQERLQKAIEVRFACHRHRMPLWLCEIHLDRFVGRISSTGTCLVLTLLMLQLNLLDLIFISQSLDNQSHLAAEQEPGTLPMDRTVQPHYLPPHLLTPAGGGAGASGGGPAPGAGGAAATPAGGGGGPGQGGRRAGQEGGRREAGAGGGRAQEAQVTGRRDHEQDSRRHHADQGGSGGVTGRWERCRLWYVGGVNWEGRNRF